MRRPCARRFAAAATAAALLSAAARADVVELKNGASLEGEVVAETDTDVTMRIEGGQFTFEKKLVSRIRRDRPAEGTPGADGAPAASAPAALPASPLEAGVPVAGEEWALLWSGDRRVGWRHAQARVEPHESVFEEETFFLGEEGKVEAEARLVEEAGPGLAPRSFLFRESAGPRQVTRSGKVEGGRLLVETFVNGERAASDHPLPPGFRLPLAARAMVLREGERLPGGWRGTTYDPRTGKFLVLSLRADRAERVLWEGEAVDALVLARTQGGALEEERVARDGRVLTADLNGATLTAVRTTRARVEALRRGEEVPATDEERRARTLWLSPEDGFRIYKPGVAWEFVGPEGPGAPVRVAVKDVTGTAFVTVRSEEAEPGEPPPPAALGAALERRLRATSAAFEKLEDGYATFAGEPAYRLLADARLKGDEVRTLAYALVRKGRVWTLTATCPRGSWEEALPFLERILEGFEWL